MVDYTQSKTSSTGGIGFIVAAVIVVLVLLYALFAGGSVETTTDPAAVGATETAPVLEEAAPVAPAVPGTE
ncbi:hypothetical protein [Yoonia sp. SDW83-1]|uniref:hypothetical protein n=1 Tax=Yoonia sp. SDW83-1 TaxID=3366945 RepID=UPI00398C3BFF